MDDAAGGVPAAVRADPATGPHPRLGLLRVGLVDVPVVEVPAFAVAGPQPGGEELLDPTLVETQMPSRVVTDVTAGVVPGGVAAGAEPRRQRGVGQAEDLRVEREPVIDFEPGYGAAP